ncbi:MULTISPECIES: UDP-4-amino-4,6-dideoxy-N-acetyl-beta-L-altrosamine transaminase [unclassified Shewanella]|uniref:UDP-4-amino-4, 6-dideoxy-N-acetyl-beta-L-altrosamine transaminase n=1 Tax=unclassified Shewanella TaxID=196818 RepID=UPI000C85B527|nr:MULTISPECIES: UDP-4-amino-4,6-dideoxy-N-acetyl-beta-L-altrosamine transaminase [unclassified Shewanella]MDO6774781.1 UDP-4-amino-4,6-dideoxy-N-acetyl-beta-L-altrosamine transaminase [Shewanella sp. 3_MG-2023]PMG74964.1 UDP-4-amino-4,6-dideoxy-N-acetyl-beta-L-altrosamine transaminase [Shewanella sp. 10N.286.51.B7]
MIPYGRQSISQQDIDAVTDVLQSDFLTQGPQVPRFEANIAAFTHSKFAVAGNSATSLLHVACLALGVTFKDTVWTSPISFVASSNCAVYCGATIDFVDINYETANLCPKALAKKLSQAALNNSLPKVIIAVHMAGHSCDMQSIAQLARQYGVKVIEDAAHAIGGRYLDFPIGSCQFSDITVFSFHPVKIITTGEGGVATTNDAKLAEAMKRSCSHGITKQSEELINSDEGDWYYEQQSLGFNYRITDLQAALGNSQLSSLESFVEKRNSLAKRYVERLKNTNVQIVLPLEETVSAYHLFIVLLPQKVDRKEVFNEMRQAGIGVHVHYIPIHLQPFYQELGFTKGDFPQAESYYQSCLTLPIFPSLTEIEQDLICEKLKGLLN